MIEVEIKTEELVTILKNNGLSITIKTNLEIVYFLDIYFNLVKEIYHLYKKPNDDPLYINKKSSDPLQEIRKLELQEIRKLSVRQQMPYAQHQLRSSNY